MPRGVDLSPSTAILQAFEQGYRERLAREELAQRKLFQTESLKQRSEESKARQKQAEAQLKATSEFHRATLGQHQADLDFRKAMEEARTKRENAKLKLDFLQGYSKGETQFPAGFYTGTGEEFDDPLKAIPEEYSPFEGVTINRSELPRIYGQKEQQEDIFKRMEMSQREQDERQMRMLLSSEARNEANIASREKISEDRIAGMLAGIELRNKKGTPPEFGENPISHPEISQFIVGSRVPKSKAEWERYSEPFSRVQWDDGSRGFVPFQQKEFDEMKAAGTSKRAVEYAVRYAGALEKGDWSTAIQIAKEIKKVIPSLKDATNAKALGVLSRQDLQMLEANLPDLTTEALSRMFRKKGGTASFGQGWNMQRAQDLYNLYKQRINALMGNRVSGQKKYYDEQYSLRPNISTSALKTWGELK